LPRVFRLGQLQIATARQRIPALAYEPSQRPDFLHLHLPAEKNLGALDQALVQFCQGRVIHDEPTLHSFPCAVQEISTAENRFGLVSFCDMNSHVMSQQVFVYGTLKRGLSNSFYLSGQRFIGEVRTRPVYRMVDCGGYPGMYAVPENGLSIAGEIWEVTDECLAQLDLLEDVIGGEYTRVKVQLLPPYDSQEIEGYLFLRDTSVLKDAGDNWRDTPQTPTGLAGRGD
jgi:gamma-glutamylcyclotransferase (GGCT)/AIG2-like uncharacterized protein YtfP